MWAVLQFKLLTWESFLVAHDLQVSVKVIKNMNVRSTTSCERSKVMMSISRVCVACLLLKGGKLDDNFANVHRTHSLLINFNRRSPTGIRTEPSFLVSAFHQWFYSSQYVLVIIATEGYVRAYTEQITVKAKHFCLNQAWNRFCKKLVKVQKSTAYPRIFMLKSWFDMLWNKCQVMLSRNSKTCMQIIP